MIRRAVIDDAERIAEIHIFGWRSAYRGIVSDAYLFGKTSVAGRIAGVRKAIDEGLEETYVFEEDGILKAFMTIGNARNADKSDAFELWGLYVEPLFKGQGVGTQMVAFCEQCARERGFTEIILWVFKDNAKSRRFYEKMGYAPDGKEETIARFNAVQVRYCKKLPTSLVHKSSALSPQHSVLSTQHSALSTQHSILSTQHSALILTPLTIPLYLSSYPLHTKKSPRRFSQPGATTNGETAPWCGSYSIIPPPRVKCRGAACLRKFHRGQMGFALESLHSLYESWLRIP